LLERNDRIMTSGTGGNSPLEHAFLRKMAGERAAPPFDAVDIEAAAVAMQCMFDDGEPKP
jgi:hypothetical protein